VKATETLLFVVIVSLAWLTQFPNTWAKIWRWALRSGLKCAEELSKQRIY
jgi:hypothetical protein